RKLIALAEEGERRANSDHARLEMERVVLVAQLERVAAVVTDLIDRADGLGLPRAVADPVMSLDVQQTPKVRVAIGDSGRPHLEADVPNTGALADPRVVRER